MTKIFIGEGFQLTLPPELQPLARIGAQFEVTVDAAGRIILTPEIEIRELLMETFAMWLDRNDLALDGVEFVNEIRRGQRLDELGISAVKNN